MSYQVLARKWRPRDFTQVVGQTHVLRALVNALDSQRLHHAYLFSGTRGVGKTSLARVFAKALNCERGVSSQPCGVCSACVEVDEGRFVDLIEVDAASRTRVDETRDLLDNVQYAPTRGRYKVYLIDEVHMLSGHSFNALLKTLEEPPPQTLIMLVTHQAQALLPTVRSRCFKLAFPVPPLAQATEWLRQQGVADPAPFLAQAGYAPLAAQVLSGDELQELRQVFLSQLSRPQALDPIALAEKNEKMDLPNMLKWLQQWLYDLIGCRLSGLIRYQPDFAGEIRALAPRLHLHAALMFQKELLAAQKIVYHPLNTQLFLEQLLLSYMQLMNPIESDHG